MFLELNSVSNIQHVWVAAALTLILLMWRIGWANNTSKWQMGFNLGFKALKHCQPNLLGSLTLYLLARKWTHNKWLTSSSIPPFTSIRSDNWGFITPHFTQLQITLTAFSSNNINIYQKKENQKLYCYNIQIWGSVHLTMLYILPRLANSAFSILKLSVRTECGPPWGFTITGTTWSSGASGPK